MPETRLEIKLYDGTTETIIYDGLAPSSVIDKLLAFVRHTILGRSEQDSQEVGDQIEIVRDRTIADENGIRITGVRDLTNPTTDIEILDSSMQARAAASHSSNMPQGDRSYPGADALVNITEDDPMTRQSEGSGRQANIEILVRKQAFANARRHAAENDSLEAGGILLGKIFRQQELIKVLVLGIVRASRAVRSSASVNFTVETWMDIWRAIDRHPDYSNDKRWCIVGWYHTHPGFGIFLSGLDLTIHEHYFVRAGHVALVIDPKRGGGEQYGFFVWNQTHDQIVQCPTQQIREMSDEDILIWLKDANALLLSALPPAEIDTQELIDGLDPGPLVFNQTTGEIKPPQEQEASKKTAPEITDLKESPQPRTEE